MKPELVIGYDENTSLPVTAACLKCGEYMPEGDRQDTSPEETIRWFGALFNLHVAEKHSRKSDALTLE